jgi:hypothetical protein
LGVDLPRKQSKPAAEAEMLVVEAATERERDRRR